MNTREVELRTGAWYGDRERTLRFPVTWSVTVLDPEPLPELGDEEIDARIRDPVASPRLRRLAADRERAAVLVDDLTRPTPVDTLLPPVLRELRRGGLGQERVRVIVAGGAHPAATSDQIRRKLGSRLARQLRVEAHRCEDELVDLGTAPGGTPILVNPTTASCDLVVGIGGVYPHTAAGFSGGVKIAAPGVCGRETARHLHQRVATGHRPGSTEGLSGPFRREAEHVARRIGLAFVVNAAVNTRREVCGVFAGDPVAAHQRGAEFVRRRYAVDDRAARSRADVLVADAYPFDVDLQFAHAKGMGPVLDGGARGASRIALAACPEGAGGHRLSPAGESILSRVWRHVRQAGPHQLARLPAKARGLVRALRQRRMELHLLAPGVSASEAGAVFPRGRLFDSWSPLLAALRRRHPDPDTRVLIYRCAPLLVRSGGWRAGAGPGEPAPLERHG